jgi:uncharacterized protein (TIGR02145 family)
MKTIVKLPKDPGHSRTIISLLLIIGLMFLILLSCQKDDINLPDKGYLKSTGIMLTSVAPDISSIMYFGHKTFSRVSEAPIVETQKLENPDFNKFDGIFLLKIQNGLDKKTRISSAEIKIDGVLVSGPSDFSKNVFIITKQLSDLRPESILEVKLNGAPGGFIDLWIEGNLKKSLIADIDGNIYKTVKIGDQLWMTENLKVKKYRNGDLIGTTTPVTLNINNEDDPKYQWPCGSSDNNVATNGRLYTWYTVSDSRNICPTGWHVPTDSEWTTLTDYLTNNGYGYGGSGDDIAKSLAATSDWVTDPNPGNPGNDQLDNNSTGFTAFPVGFRTSDGPFTSIGIFTGWWSSTESNIDNSWYRGLNNSTPFVTRSNSSKKHAGSVRCIKDQK